VLAVVISAPRRFLHVLLVLPTLVSALDRFRPSGITVAALRRWSPSPSRRWLLAGPSYPGTPQSPSRFRASGFQRRALHAKIPGGLGAPNVAPALAQQPHARPLTGVRRLACATALGFRPPCGSNTSSIHLTFGLAPAAGHGRDEQRCRPARARGADRLDRRRLAAV